MAVYGIDLGTTDSCIAYVDEAGRPVALKSAVGEDTTPSVVYFESSDNVVVGREAKAFEILMPGLVVEMVKRQMGQDVRYMFHGQEHTPETVSALILRELARAAQEQTGEEVQDVVISVPAYFGVLEREATRMAGRIAGLNVLDVLAEPVAAALAYETVGQRSGQRHVFVYDLGGGTFDTTVIQIDDDEIQVVCTDGDGSLGGAEWDAKIGDFLLQGFADQFPELDPLGDKEFMQEIATSAEQLKKALSAVRARKCNVRFGSSVARLELTREQLEDLTSELLERTMEITGRTIEMARDKGVDRFDDVLLVGGMTVMPAIARTLKARFGLEGRRQDPQLAVAKGAALFALMKRVKISLASDSEATLAAGAISEVANQLGITAEKVRSLAAKSVATVVPRAFGLKVVDSTDPSQQRTYILHLLEANRPLPADVRDTFMTVADNQSEVHLEIWEQAGSVASPELEHNAYIGEAVLGNLPPRPAGTPFEVSFHMTETGLLEVHGREVSSGQDVRFELQIGGLDETELRVAANTLARYAVSGSTYEESAPVHEVVGREAAYLNVPDTAPSEPAERVEVLREPRTKSRQDPDSASGPAASGADLPASRPGGVQRYLALDMPSRIPVMADLSILVRITGDLPDPPRAAAPLKWFEPQPDGTLVTIIMQAPAQLRPTEALEQVLVVPAQGDSEPARFAFRAERPGLFKVRVTAFTGGTFLGELAAEVSVEANGRRTDGRRLVADLGHLHAEPGEVTLQVRFDGDRYTFQLLSDSYLFGPVLAEALTAQPGEAVERTLAMLRAMAARRSGYTAGNARRWMREAGVGLWKDMVPDLIKEQFWQLRSSIAAFSIVCGRDTIPWELLYPLSTSGADAGFLVDQFPVLRRVYDQRRCRFLSLGPAFYVVPPKRPTNALDEVTALQRKLGAEVDPIGDLETLMTLIDSGDFGILHFACHNAFRSNAGGSSVAMDGGPFVPALLNAAVTTKAFAARSPLVFINACRSAGVVPEYTQLLGWAGQFMAAGAGAFVGTLWAVPSDSARVFADAFYDCLKSSRTLGKAVQEARKAVSHDIADPSWLAYSIYGDPTAIAAAS